MLFALGFEKRGVLVCRRVLRRFEFPTKRPAGAAAGGEDGLEYPRRPSH